MKKTRTRTLALSIMRALVGLALVAISTFIFDFRHTGGWSSINGEHIYSIALFAMFIEWGTALVGIYLSAFGVIGIIENVKKMR